MWGAMIPLVLFIVLLYFISLDKIVLLITFLTPLAINFESSEFGLGISIPTEPLMIGVLIFFLIKLLYEGKYDTRVLRHPLTVAIVFYLVWMLFTSIKSEIPLVSFKFLFSKLWFIVPFYFFAILMFKKYSNIKLFSWLYLIPFLGVIFYTIINHSVRGFDEESGHWVMTPFYNDHTAYGALLALFIPMLAVFSFNKKYNFSARLISFGFLFVFLVAIVLSYSRAAWISLAVSAVVFIIIILRIKFRWVFITAAVLVISFFTFQQQILDRLEQNKESSSSNLTEHVRSIYNITSNASNLERINRWQSAIRMFRARPFWGWGPGTYQFMYAPFQMSQEKTLISTNAGDLGNAHSEYIGPLAETGVLGMFSILLVFGMSIYYGLKVYRKADSREVQLIALAIVLGLISYYIHGFLNNFLDTDKASVPVWGFMAILIALDLYHCNKLKEKT